MDNIRFECLNLFTDATQEDIRQTEFSFFTQGKRGWHP